MAFVGIISLLFILLGATFGWLAFFSYRKLDRQIKDLQKEIANLKGSDTGLIYPGRHAVAQPDLQKPVATGPVITNPVWQRPVPIIGDRPR